MAGNDWSRDEAMVAMDDAIPWNGYNIRLMLLADR